MSQADDNNQECCSDDDLEGINVHFCNVNDLPIISTRDYIAGFIALKIKRYVDNCSVCTNQLQDRHPQMNIL